VEHAVVELEDRGVQGQLVVVAAASELVVPGAQGLVPAGS
jgi:hypothetical protein